MADRPWHRRGIDLLDRGGDTDAKGALQGPLGGYFDAGCGRGFAWHVRAAGELFSGAESGFGESGGGVAAE